MKKAVMDREVPEDWKAELGPDGKLQPGPANDEKVSRLFRAYFNNKMTLLVFLIQSKTLKPSPHLLDEIFRFLNDLYHHMLTGANQERHRHVFEWLKAFFQTLPDASQDQRVQAREFVRSLYDAIGMDLKSDL